MRKEPQYKMLCKYNNCELWVQQLNNKWEKLDTPFYFMDYVNDRNRTPRVWDSWDLVDVIKYLLLSLYQTERDLKYNNIWKDWEITMNNIIQEKKIFLDKVMEYEYTLNYK